MINRLSWTEVRHLAYAAADRHRHQPLDGVFGIPQGGVPVAAMIGVRLGIPTIVDPADVTDHTLIVDDIVDSGRTAQRWITGGWFDALIRRVGSPPHLAPEATVLEGWVQFPWEAAATPEDAVTRLLQHIGEDPTREGLVDTPARVTRALTEMTGGYADDPAAILATQFGDRCDELVILRGIEFVSMCEHHMLPFLGTAHVGYLPGERVVGLSKLARLVECFARRLQVQERMTQQIADALEEHLSPRGVGVVLTAHHSCMGCRGVRKPTARMITSAMRGRLRESDAARAEFLTLADVG